MNKINDDKTDNSTDNREETTKYGEFISSYFAWMTLEEQKKKANKLSNITKKEKE